MSDVKVTLTNKSALEVFSFTTHGGGRVSVNPGESIEIAIDPIRYSASYDYLKAYYNKFSDNLTAVYTGMESSGEEGITEAAADLKYAAKDDVYTKEEADLKFEPKSE